MSQSGKRPPSVSMRPGGTNSTASYQDVDLNLSQGSEQSVVTLGGVEYPVGSRIGKSGMFVIGNPAGFPRHDTSGVSNRSSAASTGTSLPAFRGEGMGYNFEYWNWNIIRFVCFLIVCLIMVGLLAGAIAVAVQHKSKCEAQFLWWQGSTFYNLPVPYFHDSDNSNIGDFIGIEKKDTYLEYIKAEGIVLKNFLWSELTDWEQIISFTDIDPRLGTPDDFKETLKSLHDKDIRLLLHICPWYTSIQHVWYIESREMSSPEYRDFYIWSDQPDPSRDGSLIYGDDTPFAWEYDPFRSQYYLHRRDKTKPLLDWSNPQVAETFDGILRWWLNKGVDGFVLCEVSKFYIESETDIYTALGRFHDTLNTYSLGDDSQKILAVDSSYIDILKSNSSSLLTLVLQKIDMLQAPLTMDQENKTGSLIGQVHKQLEWQVDKDSPWILWDLTGLSGLGFNYLGALELFNLMLPGTPSYTAGQELGLYYLENDVRYQAPMVWQSETSLPFNPGGPISNYNIEALHNVSREREKTFALRLDQIAGQETEGVTYNIQVDDVKDFMMLSRYYPSDNTYYFVGNFGDKELKKDFTQDIAPWATVLADSHNKFNGRLELKEVILEPGQALVMYPTK